MDFTQYIILPDVNVLIHWPLRALVLVSLGSILFNSGRGDDLEYTDELTLGRSIMKRVPYESSA